MSTIQIRKPACVFLALLMALIILQAMQLPARAGVMADLLYQSGYPGGNAVTNLTIGDGSFPASPDGAAGQTNGLQDFSTGIGSNFGTWMRGWIEAPQTGSYIFWIASDADSQLWLSTDGTTNNRVLICQNIGAVGVQQYNVTAAQQSAHITLVAGQKYYFEVFHTEGSGTAEHCEVAWQLPDSTYEAVIQPQHLWAFTENNLTGAPQPEAPQILSSYLTAPNVASLAGSYSVLQAQPLDLAITAEASQPATVQWYSNSVAIPGAILQDYHIAAVPLSANNAVYSVIVSNDQGTATSSTTLSVSPDTTPPTLADALNLGNPAGDITVVYSKTVDPTTATTTGNYAISGGATITGARMGTSPNTVLLQVAGLSVGTAYTITVNNVQDLPGNVIAANSQVTLEANLDTWYRLDENGGSVAADSSGNGNNGALFNDTALGYTGKVLKAIKFAGVTGGFVKFPSVYRDFTTNGLTIALWAYPTIEGAQASWDRFTDFGNTNNSDNIIFSRNATSRQIHFEVYKGAASGGVVNGPDGSLVINQWQHVVATLDGSGNVVLYRNGVAIANGTVAIPNVVNRTNNLLGHSLWSGDDFYTGKMDDVRVYYRVLSPAAVAALANGGGPDDVNTNIPSVSLVTTVPTTALKNTPPGVFTITRSSATNVALTVQYTLSGTATNGVTYTSLSGSVVIPVGTNSATVTIQPIDFSFQGIQQTAVLQLTDTANYSIGDSDSGTVTIQNNDVTPAAIEATTANGIGSQPVTMDVWFSAPVANPSATTLGNYTLVNAPGVNITNAVLTSRNLRVVLSVDNTLPTGAQVSVHGVQDPGGNTSPAQIPIRLGLTNPANVVANIYHGGTGTRATAFAWMTDGVINNVNNGGTGFDTFDNAGSPAPFAGLQYLTAEDIQVIRVDLGQQFSDGGDWLSQPSVYLLTNALDTGSVAPNTNAANWVRVNAQLISGGQFQSAVDANPSLNTPLVFDLTALPVNQRKAYGWAVGGTNGNGAKHFLSFTELRAFGTSYTDPATIFVTQPTNITVQAGQRAKFSAVVDSVLPVIPQWNDNGSAAPGLSALSVVFPWPSLVNESSYATPPLTMADNGSQFTFVANNAVGAITSQTATLTVLPRTTPPTIVDATYDPSNNVVELWFDESTDPSSSQNSANYTLSDSTSVAGAAQDAEGFHVTLSLSGTPNITNLTVTAAGVLDTSGNTITSQTVTVQPLVAFPVNLMANGYQQGYYTARNRSTDGVVIHDANVTTWTTFTAAGLFANSQFVGLQYSQPSIFNLLKVDLGNQYVDGGDWAAQPQVFILKNPVYTAQTAPETDPADWQPVPAKLTSGSIFDIMPDAPANTVPPPNTPIAFDLSQLPLSQRTGYGWAIGGVPGNGPNAHFVSIAELRGFGQPVTALIPGSGAPQIVFNLPATPVIQQVGASFNSSIGATGSQPLSYQWYHNGAPLVDNGRVTGSQTSGLTVATVGGVDGGTYQVIVTNSFGSVTSAVESVTFAATVLNNGLGWVLNSVTTNVPIATNKLVLTDGAGGETRSAFLSSPKYIRAFQASYIYQDVGGGGADGTCFVLQDDPRGTTALGGGGGQLGYTGITPSVALEFNIYSGNAPSTNSSGFNFQVNGVTGKPYLDASPVNPAGGNPIWVSLAYDGTTVSILFSNTVTGGQIATNFVADLPTVLGTNTAYVGFTGASGGVASKQVVSNFSFTSLFPTLSVQATAGNTATISWAAAGGTLTLQQCPSLMTQNWADVTTPINLAGSQNQVVVPVTGQTMFYRIQLQ